QGYVAPEFINVKKAFITNFENGEEVGSSVAVYYDGKLVVDLQGGYADLETMHEYDNNTLQQVFSCTKAFSAIVIARLVDQGILDYNEKISTYWPEFAQGNKENVTLKDLVNHCGGVSYFDKVVKSDLEDLDKLAKILAAQPHAFGGVPNRAYHAVTYGWYLNEVVRRVDPKHRTIGKIVSEEILTQYDLEFYISFPPSLISRVAKIYKTSTVKTTIEMLSVFKSWWAGKVPGSFFSEFINKESVIYKTYEALYPLSTTPIDHSKLEIVTVEWPSANGLTNAKSIAKLGAMIVNNGQSLSDDSSSSSSSVSSKPFLSKSIVDLISIKSPAIFDYVYYYNITPSFGGFVYIRFPGIEDVEFLGWGGYGGSLFIWNRELGISFGYAMNGLRMHPMGELSDKRAWSILKEVVNVVKKLKREQA
ncbi:4723_t:CDS:2, partial [Racocetra fulgida]